MRLRFSARGFALLFGVGFEGSLAVLAWLLGWLLDQPPLQHLHGTLPDALLGVAATFPMLVVFLISLRLPYRPMVRIREFVDQILRPLLGPCTLFDLALLSAVAGVGEEMLFRGVLQPALERWAGVWPSLAGASLLFGLMHPINLLYIALASLLGFYLGWIYVTRDNLLSPILAHALYDFVVLVYVVRRPLSADRPENA
jgi:membrane protease YdiL (CAAX protease family)